jgi:hypothetical protein
MDFAICLDQFSTNFNVSSLSPNGFSIYTDLDYSNPIASGIPYQDLFAPPIGNCPLVVNIPQGATQLLVIDACTTLPTNVAPIFNAGSSANSLITQCCYAILPVPVEQISWCNTSGLEFDIFSSSSIGQIVAGNLTSILGTVTDYTIGWYKDGDYSSPEFISGYGNSFLPYQNLHPLTGNSSVPVLAGDWEGIIHDIAINGITYSSVSGSANGQPIPFESCFDTVVVNPLTCDNGTISPSVSKYSHQINYNSQAIGTTSAPTSLTYTLDSTTKYFAYIFQGYNIWDELEIKFKSGNPAATSNPSLYSQPIYLEKLKIGNDAPGPVNPLPQFSNQLPSYPSTPPPANSVILNNVWPKSYGTNTYFQRTLTLTSLETSSNPSLPDLLEITITPNPSNNNTQWKAGFQCLENFDCTNCVWDNFPNNLPKIWKFRLQKQYGCNKQNLVLYFSSSCDPSSITSDWMGYPYPPGGFIPDPFNSPTSNLISSFTPNQPQQFSIPSNFISLTPSVSCATTLFGTFACGTPSTGQITLNKTPNQIQLTFNLESDYLHYKNALINTFNDASTSQLGTPLTSPIPCSGTNNTDYYRFFQIGIPTQGPNANCGDNTTPVAYNFHFNDYFNIQYVESPSTNTWSITIPQTLMANCYPQNQPCDTCYNTITGFVNNYNTQINNLSFFTFTTNVGSKYADPVRRIVLNRFSTGGTSGSYCFNSPTYSQTYIWYATNTVPFVSSSTGWTNLYSLQTALPCITSSYPNARNASPYGVIYDGGMYGYQVRFPNLTGSFNYSLSTNNFEVYALTNLTNTGSWDFTQNVWTLPCPETSGSKIYSYIGGVATVHTASQFWNGTTPILVIDP